MVEFPNMFDISQRASFLDFSKKEEQLQFQNQTADHRDFSRTLLTTTSDARQFAFTNAPTIVLNSAGANTSGSNVSATSSPDVRQSPSTKKESSSASDARASAELSSGIDVMKIALIGAAVGGAFLLVKPAKKVLSKTPVGKVAKTVLGSKKK